MNSFTPEPSFGGQGGLLKPDGNYQVSGMLWLELDGQRCFGPGRMQLLEGIAKTGSINKAAKEMGMSYKKAWTMIKELNKQFTTPMVITQSGGEGGGGSALTPAAKQLMEYYLSMRTRYRQFLQEESAKLSG